jgi:hypothetical protein
MLLALAERRLRIADRLAAEIIDRRDPTRLFMRFPTSCALAYWLLLAAMKMPTISIVCAATRLSNSPAVTCRTAGVIYVHSRPCRAGRTHPACAR